VTKLHKVTAAGMPSDKDIMRIPLARHGEFELTDKEVKTLRSRIYALNKDNAGGRRWRTMRDGTLLMVWRIR
jgi:hypothetical protein